MEEIKMISELSDFLRDSGDVETVYITAEFEPFSNQRKPDLIFYPNGHNFNIFIEYKKIPPEGFTESYCQTILEHRDFIKNESNNKLIYIYCTDGKIQTDLARYLKENSIYLLDSQYSSKGLADRILKTIDSIDCI